MNPEKYVPQMNVEKYFEKYDPKNCAEKDIDNVLARAWKDYCEGEGLDWDTERGEEFAKEVYMQCIFGDKWATELFYDPMWGGRKKKFAK